MNVILIFNGLGNQMSQYAFYLAKKKRGQHCLPMYYISKGYSHNGQELTRLFGLHVHEGWYARVLYRFFYKFRGFSRVYRLTKSFVSAVFEHECYDFSEDNLDYDRGGLNFFHGGWHCERYFLEVEQEVRKAFTFNESLVNEETRRWASEIANGADSCSLHIRRGDFLEKSMWQGICTDDYYDKAMKLMQQRFGDIDYFIFSNDIAWCREKFVGDKFHFIDCNHGADAWQDMYLMSCCKNHINANSSFSWWGAWLNPVEGGVTVCPSRFLSDRVVKDIYPDSWIKI